MTELLQVFLFILVLTVTVPCVFWSLVGWGYPAIIAEEIAESRRLFIQVERTLEDNAKLRERLRQMGVYDD
jgi:hypothetical protein